jgi:hypothetical protein
MLHRILLTIFLAVMTVAQDTPEFNPGVTLALDLLPVAQGRAFIFGKILDVIRSFPVPDIENDTVTLKNNSFNITGNPDTT